MLVSPAEPRPFLALSEDAEYSTLPEQVGADFVAFPQGKMLGIQRKACADLIASIRGDDREEGGDRLARELGQMRDRLDYAAFLVEGEWRWDKDGKCRLKGYDHAFLKAQYDGITIRLQAMGIMVVTSLDIDDSLRVLPQIVRHHETGDHRSLLDRQPPRGLWATPACKDWAIGVYQQVPGFKTSMADRVYDTIGLPIHLDTTEEELLSIPGIGPIRAKAVLRAFPRMNGALDGATHHPVR